MFDYLTNDEIVNSYNLACNVEARWQAEVERLERAADPRRQFDSPALEAAQSELSVRIERADALLDEMLRRGLARGSR